MPQYGLIAGQYNQQKDISERMGMLPGKIKGWFCDATNVEAQSGFLKITTPFLDAHNDYIQFYAVEKGDNYLVTDDGYTTQVLELFGFSLDDKRVQGFLSMISKRFKVDCVNGALCVTAQASHYFPADFKNLIQAVILLDTLPYLIDPDLPKAEQTIKPG